MSVEVSVWVVARVLGDDIEVLAQDYLRAGKAPQIDEIVRENEQVHRMIEMIASGKAIFTGPKGDLLLWGSVWNYADVVEFIRQALPFWMYLWHAKGPSGDSGIFTFENIVVFSETEQQSQQKIYEITSAGLVFERENKFERLDKDWWLYRDMDLVALKEQPFSFED